jgi:hypothetical protein
MLSLLYSESRGFSWLSLDLVDILEGFGMDYPVECSSWCELPSNKAAMGVVELSREWNSLPSVFVWRVVFGATSTNSPIKPLLIASFFDKVWKGFFGRAKVFGIRDGLC